ncbi:carbohydrate ABC transporter permease [Nakamurella sp. A5-74]|uniref:Carbohydrate ABC transporter permease n=1 Tax=Nakamurella sp. A5-74 TaxID=3158264 RepID=A0AAU8DP52_9ACTN
MTATDVRPARPSRAGRKAAIATPSPLRRGSKKSRIAIITFLVIAAMLWMIPLLWTFYTSLRPYDYFKDHSYFSIGGPYNFDNYGEAWKQAELPKFFLNSAIITIPAVIITLALSSLAAFKLSRVPWKWNIPLLILFTAGNLLPQQVLATPLFQMAKHTPLPLSVSDSGSFINTYYVVIAVNVAFQLGFCTFVMSNYMKALPHELTEAAQVDGAGLWKQYWNIILPLCRPPLAALATLEFIWVYNDFFWALLLVQKGDRLPITSGLNNLNGQFAQNYNLLSAGALLSAVPVLIIYLVLQRQFVAGLTLGANKG